MTDSQHLQVSPMAPNLATPSKRGHRHKRSFAISGDFEFLKQPQTVPRLHTEELEVPFLEAPNNIFNPHINLHDNNATLLPPQQDFLNLTPRKNTTNTASPRFFVSQEPQFSSPIKGVPDAIINLDDALKTRPRSFKSHRRTESAPADLEVILPMRPLSTPNLRIDEEEVDDDDSSEKDDEGDDDGNKESRKDIQAGLLSPLRPKNPYNLRSSSGKDGNSNRNSPLISYNESPTKKKTLSHNKTEQNGDDNDSNGTNGNEANDSNNTANNISANTTNNGRTNINNKFNTLKIQRQKERYFHYTNQFPISKPPIVQAQTLSEKKSSASLTSSNISKTPGSYAYTPSKQLSTPGTPFSISNKDTLPSLRNEGLRCEDSKRRPISPVNRHHQEHQLFSPQRLHPSYGSSTAKRRGSSGSNVIYSSFKFESREYDIPYEKDLQKSTAPANKKNINDTVNTMYSSPCSSSITTIGIVSDDSDVGKHQTNHNIQFHPTNNIEGHVEISVDKGTAYAYPLSKDILLGEPGDKVDLTLMDANSKTLVKGLNEFSFEEDGKSHCELGGNNRCIEDDKSKGNFTKEGRLNNVTKEQLRSVSDSTLETKNQKNKNKRKSRLSTFMSFFSK
ncbi:Lre1p NDAI_0A00240 [Naumovozyma dairenensis CBS 421]|uniref:Laminarase-resistance protein LRE1 n=1 Tax=Naumovozyma dairenensis (strain ATCC 10597 / BCRC 20456 / CBS 421 / NBRC 0211 / NRRL Y-12639) TaxID=1071378 RepID=G0W5H0_NAUDC|nr:hypothetical protein NDAI_0A00240 [Naumovozyma dairenensis CBS 421]CCD22184.1 hypothetical protein NDAI_0A00240 [Naumovozyma dairenensis CBS 421]